MSLQQHQQQTRHESIDEKGLAKLEPNQHLIFMNLLNSILTFGTVWEFTCWDTYNMWHRSYTWYMHQNCLRYFSKYWLIRFYSGAVTIWLKKNGRMVWIFMSWYSY